MVVPAIPRVVRVTVPAPALGSLRLSVVADTHGAPHPRLRPQLEDLRPHAIVHAGDIGDPSVLDGLAEVAPVLAVRGNVDPRGPHLPDELVIDLGTWARVLLVHHGVRGPRLLREVARRAHVIGAGVVICGHSHVPFVGRDAGLVVFNPGSVGPRRFGLPIVHGWIEIDADGLRAAHVDAETGAVWTP